MSNNDAWTGPMSDSHADLITAKATKKKSEGGTDAVGTLETGAIGVKKATKPKTTAAKPAATKKEVKATVALHSTKNVHWEGVGKVEKGYNIVSAKHAEQWLTRSHIREATPEEVAREFGK